VREPEHDQLIGDSAGIARVRQQVERLERGSLEEQPDA
jgi:hypothetical protein